MLQKIEVRPITSSSMAYQTCLIGYPPADHEVRNFLTKDTRVISHSFAVSLVQHFLLALFNKAKMVLTSREMGRTKLDRIQNFRAYMSKDQSMDSTGKNRNEFYDGVIAQARQARCRFFIPFVPSNTVLKKTSDSNVELDSAELIRALEELRKELNSGDEEPSKNYIHIDNAPASHIRGVDVFIAFDEAHTLADSFDDTHESRFVVLRRILGSLSSAPLFSFFLSTTGKITQFGQPRGQDASDRINDGSLATPRPYIYLGFDQLMQSRKILARQTTLDDVVSLECVAHMGRPL